MKNKIIEMIKDINNLPPAELNRILSRINEILYGSDGIRDIYLNCILLFKEYPENPEDLSSSAKRLLKNQFDFCNNRLFKIEELITKLNRLHELVEKYNEDFVAEIKCMIKEIKCSKDSFKEDTIQLSSEQKKTFLKLYEDKLNEMEEYLINLSKTVSDNFETAKKILDNTENILGFAYKVEDLAKIALQAKAIVEVEEFELTYKKGIEITLTIEPVGNPILSRYATKPSSEMKLTLHRQWYLRPLVGLSFIVANSAVFPTYATKEVEGGFKIIENLKSQDSRFNLGLSLGITYPPCDHRVDKGWAFWFPEITINPISETKFIGAGLAFTFRGIKIGTGALWVKRDWLGGGQNIDDILLASTDLIVNNKYSKKQIYISISIIDWPPFKK
jgi:hypothetical protein